MIQSGTWEFPALLCPGTWDGEALPSAGIYPLQPPLECATLSCTLLLTRTTHSKAKRQVGSWVGLGGWRKPGSITSLKEKSPSSLPLPKLVSPDLPGVLVDHDNLAPGSSPGRWGRTGRAQCLMSVWCPPHCKLKGLGESASALHASSSPLLSQPTPGHLWTGVRPRGCRPEFRNP